MQILPSKRAELPQLIEQFSASYLRSSQGENALRAYAQSRSQAKRSYDHLTHLYDQHQPISESALSRLLPYENTLAHFEQGCWIHPTPALSADPRDLFDTVPEDVWISYGAALFTWTQRCIHAQTPNEVQDACAALAYTPPHNILSVSALSPILHALDPQRFCNISPSVATLLRTLFDTPIRHQVSSYPHTNALALHTLKHFDELLQRPKPLQKTPSFDLLCAFASWLIRSNTHTDPSPKRTWLLNISPRTPWIWDPNRNTLSLNTTPDLDLNTLPNTELGLWSAPASPTQAILAMQPHDTVLLSTDPNTPATTVEISTPYLYTPHTSHTVLVQPTHTTAHLPDDLKTSTLKQPFALLDNTHIPTTPTDPPPNDTPNPNDNPPTEPFEELDLDHPFSSITFQLLQHLNTHPTIEFYTSHQDRIETHVEWPLEQALRIVARNLPHTMRSAFETEKHLFERIPRTDFGQHKARDWYQGVLALQGIKRSKSPQFFIHINQYRLSAGFRIPKRAKTARTALLTHLKRHSAVLPSLLTDLRQWPGALEYGTRDSNDDPSNLVSSWRTWAQNPEQHGLQIATSWSAQEAANTTFDTVVRTLVRLFERLYPLILLTNHPNPLLAISEHTGTGYDEPILDLQPNPPTEPSQSLSEISNTSNIPISTLERWVRAIDRKGQAILYGPPGTGKTFLASLLAQHLIEGGDGFTDLVQFHPAYAYEDFIQGIRPHAREDGTLSYELHPGRFLDFCAKAQGRSSRCVLIIDEINRADISRVFGELMYVLEYRDREIPLASGGLFQLPENVRIIGTMNTADRSIALVDHALRRRFAFFKLLPDVHILRSYHKRTQTPIEGLIDVLTEINRTINDPHYALGISFFLTPDLSETLEDIWIMEVEPYLEEYFFDQPEHVDSFRWTRIARRVTPPI